MRITGLPIRATIALTLASTVFACGGSSSTSPTTPDGPIVDSATITISASGASPHAIRVSAGTQVTFVNHDTQAHEMFSDPHPEHTDCPELNQVGHLEPGQSRQSGNLTVVRTCGFHDHIHPDSAALKGTITVQ